jgi:F-type H+-transporting ATPase subunit gamma
MPNLRDIRTRIQSVIKTRQITQAMKLVAAAKLRGATDRALAAQPYQGTLRAVLGRVSSGQGGGDDQNPLLRTPEQVKKVLLVLYTSDRGLCGGFNNVLMRRSLTWMAERRADGVEIEVRVFGRKGRDFCNVRQIKPTDAVLDYARTPKMELVRPIADTAVRGFVEGEYDEVWVGYNLFKSAATQIPTFSRVLPLALDGQGDGADGGESADYLYEPGAGQLLDSLLPLYLRTLFLQAFLDTEAGEFAARMMAMDAATRNAGELIKTLTLQYNRARQAAITTEITEIVSGAEAL